MKHHKIKELTLHVTQVLNKQNIELLTCAIKELEEITVADIENSHWSFAPGSKVVVMGMIPSAMSLISGVGLSGPVIMKILASIGSIIGGGAVAGIAIITGVGAMIADCTKDLLMKLTGKGIDEGLRMFKSQFGGMLKNALKNSEIIEEVHCWCNEKAPAEKTINVSDRLAFNYQESGMFAEQTYGIFVYPGRIGFEYFLSKLKDTDKVFFTYDRTLLVMLYGEELLGKTEELHPKAPFDEQDYIALRKALAIGWIEFYKSNSWKKDWSRLAS